MTRILRYILQDDNGMAPCIDRSLVSLATCKPKIRASAAPGEWVVGFRPSPAPRGIVIWAGQVAHRAEVGDYEFRYRGRSDAVYRAEPNGEIKRLRPDYHPGEDEFRKDMSAPVLIFDPHATWYFGSDTHMLPENLMHLAASGRGHRVNGVNDGDAAELKSWLSSIAPAGILGRPHNPAPKRVRCS